MLKSDPKCSSLSLNVYLYRHKSFKKNSNNLISYTVECIENILVRYQSKCSSQHSTQYIEASTLRSKKKRKQLLFGNHFVLFCLVLFSCNNNSCGEYVENASNPLV